MLHYVVFFRHRFVQYVQKIYDFVSTVLLGLNVIMVYMCKNCSYFYIIIFTLSASTCFNSYKILDDKLLMTTAVSCE